MNSTRALLETVAGFGTWDEVELNGGLMCKGDVLDLGLGEAIDAWQEGRKAPLLGSVVHLEVSCPCSKRPQADSTSNPANATSKQNFPLVKR